MALDAGSQLGLLSGYRQKDELNAEHEAIPEKQTLNFRYVQQFLRNEGITADNFDRQFNMQAAMKMVKNDTSRSVGAAEMSKDLADANSFLDKQGLGGLFEGTSKTTLRPNISDEAILSNINEELAKRHLEKEQARIEHAFMIYKTVRDYSRRQLLVTKQTQDLTAEEKRGVLEKGKDSVMDSMESIKENLKNMEWWQIAIAGVGAMYALANVMTSESPAMQRLKANLGAIAGLGIFGVGANYAWQVGTGETGLEALDKALSKSGVKNKKFFRENFRSRNKEGSDALAKGLFVLKDEDFLELVHKYETAKGDTSNKGPKKVELVNVSKNDMSPEEVYLALETFFNEHPEKKLRSKYAQYKPRPVFAEVVTTELVENGKIKLDDGVVDAASTAVSSAFTHSYNKIAPMAREAWDSINTGKFAKGMADAGKAGGRFIGEVGSGVGRGGGAILGGVVAGGTGMVVGGVKGAFEGFEAGDDSLMEDSKEVKEYFKGLWRRVMGSDGTDDEIQAWVEKDLKNNRKYAELPQFINQKNSVLNYREGFTAAFQRGKDEGNVKWIEHGDSIYLMTSGGKVDFVNNDVDHANALKKADTAGREFLKKQYGSKNPELNEHIDDFADLHASTYVMDRANFVALIRMPKPGSDEYNLRRIGQRPPEVLLRRHRESMLFSDKTPPIDYNRFSTKSQKERFRLRYFLDETQTDALKKVGEFLTAKYRNQKTLAVDVAIRRVFENEQDQREALEYLKTMGIEPKLLEGKSALESVESDISSIEKSARSKVNGNEDFKRKFYEDQQKGVINTGGVKVRLAILGDVNMRKELNYEPGSPDKNKINTVEKLLKEYEKDLDVYVDQVNKNGKL